MKFSGDIIAAESGSLEANDENDSFVALLVQMANIPNGDDGIYASTASYVLSNMHYAVASQHSVDRQGLYSKLPYGNSFFLTGKQTSVTQLSGLASWPGLTW
ncbi:MAG: hypothetical protein FWG30_06525 [Eubacteriaceae bacterium]|nr:hypothetical protein [Eubacteriaceae bacterium]